MPAATRSLFRDAALLSSLVTRADIDAAVALIQTDPDASPAPLTLIPDSMLADKLVDMEVITRYQADQLLAGRNKLNLGPYIITDWIAQGGMGQVFKAEHKMMGRESAVKVLPLNKSTPEAIANFNREIRTQAQLDHPNLVRAYDAGHDGNVYYLVVEYVPGTDLRRLVRSQGPLSVQQAANIIMQAARGLDYAHQRGLIHRDVKPGNILVRPDGVAKVSDLGLAGFVDKAENDPRAGKIVGTADYLSPEQILSPAEITPTSDIYSLGCTLYYAVCGKVPFPGGTPASKAKRHLEETPWHPRRFAPDISEEFVELIADMMEKKPDDRAQSAAEVATRLEPWASDIGPIRTQHLSKSPWTPPPLPTGGEDDAQETNPGFAEFEDVGSGHFDPSSQGSDGTFPLLSGLQETSRVRTNHSRRKPPILLLSEAKTLIESPTITKSAAVVIALAIAVPAALLLGAIMGFLVGSVMN